MKKQTGLIGIIAILITSAIYLLITAPQRIKSQNIRIHPLAYHVDSIVKISSEVKETSGLIFYDDLYWTINDSKNKAILYALNSKGKVMRKVKIKNATNTDWEALTQNEEYIFIGDIGDNKGIRDSLIIYRISKAEIRTHSIIEADKIVVRYPDKNSDIYIPFHHPFDCESMVYKDSLIWLFTKDWEHKSSSIYSTLAHPGSYMAKFVTKLNINGLITDATYNENTDQLILSGYLEYNSFIIRFDNIGTFPDLEKMKYEKFFFKDMYHYQNEGITYFNETDLIISNERSGFKESLLFLSANN